MRADTFIQNRSFQEKMYNRVAGGGLMNQRGKSM